MSRRATRLVALLSFLVAVCLALPAGAFAAKTLGLSSGTFLLSASAGKTVGGEVFVTNDGTEAIKVLVYSSDQKVDAKGNITYSVPSRGDLSALDQPSTWAQIKMPEDSKSLGNIPYIELTPGQRVPVKFSFTVPPNVPPGDHNVLIFFEMFEMPQAGEGAVSAISGRLGSRITLRVAGEFVERLEVRPFVVPAFVIGGEVPYRFTARNEGNIDQRVGARMLLLNRSDEVLVEQTPIDSRIVFAGSNLEATGTALVQRGGIGPYKVRIDVTAVDDEGKPIDAGKDTITQTRTVWLLPLWLVVAIGALLVLIVWRLVWMFALRSARKSTVRDDDTTPPAKRSRRLRSGDAVAEARREAREQRRAAGGSAANEASDAESVAPVVPVVQAVPSDQEAPND